MTLADLEAVVKKHMLLADDAIIKLLASFIVAARLPINPPWLFIIGPPSGGKSQLLKSLHNCKGVFPIDDLTATTFASGMRGKDGQSNSLIDNLLPNSVLLFKDFTTIISKDQESRAIVIGQMRKIFDGDFRKTFGNGMQVDWHGKLSVLAGVTEKIYPSMEIFADMGERFLMYEFKQPDRKAVGHRAANSLEDAIAQAEMKRAFTEFIESIEIPTVLPILDEKTKDQIVDLAEFVTRARTPVLRDKFSRDKAIIQVYKPEMTPRFVKQVLGLALGLMIVNQGKITDFDRHLICTLALDSIPSIRRHCLKALTKYEEVETTTLGLHLKYPTDSIRMHLQNLAALETIEYTKGPGNRDRWRLKDEYRQIMSYHEGIQPTTEVLDEEAPLPEEPEFLKTFPDPTVEKAVEIMGGLVET